MVPAGTEIKVSGRISVIARKGGYICIDHLTREVAELLGAPNRDHTWIDGYKQGWPYHRDELYAGIYVEFTATTYPHPHKKEMAVGNIKDIIEIG